MKKTEILKELKEIKELISKNLISAWERDLGSTIDAVALSDFEEGTEEEPVTLEYNGWRDRFETLIKALEESTPTREEVMIRNLGSYLGGDGLCDNGEAILEKLGELEVEKGTEIFEGEMIEEFDVYIAERFVDMFTVNQFVEQIDTFDYEQ